MTRPAKKSSSGKTPPPQQRTSLLSLSAFVMTLALIIARATMSETLRDSMDISPGSDPTPRGVGPASSMLLNALCCVPALLIGLRRVIDRDFVLRWTWSQLLFAAFALWALISTAWATDKFAAFVTATHMIAAATLLWSTTQLVRSWLRLRIVAGVCLGLLLAYTAHGLIYRYVDVPQNTQFWKENRDRLLAERGWEPESFQAKQFEKKVVGGDMIGFNTSPNSFAAVMVVLLVVSAGIAIQRCANNDHPAWMIAIVLAFLPAIWVLNFTDSRTAMGTLLLSAIGLAALASTRVRRILAERPRVVYFASAVIIILGVAAVIGHGVYHGTLFHDSLNFRWRYWSASAQLIKQHALLGVGWSNFGPHYLAVRWPQAAEEIRDPHNFVVRAFAELGFVGGVILLAWMARAAWEITRPHQSAAPSTSSSTTTLFALTVAVLLAAVLTTAIGIDWSQQNSAYTFLETFRRVMFMGLIAVGLLLALARGGEEPLDDRPAAWVLYGIIIAIAAMTVHAMMDFVLAEPGPLILFVVLIGATLGIRMPPATGLKRHRKLAIGLLSVGALAWIILVAAHVIPLADAESRAAQADELIRTGEFNRAAGLYRSAFDTIPSNADYAYRAARAMMFAAAPPEQIKATLAFAIERDPMNVAYYLTRAMFELHQPVPDFPAVQRDFDSAIKLDPQNIPMRLDYAAALVKHNSPAAAIEQYRQALSISDKYDRTEPKRLSPGRIAQIQETIKSLENK